VLQRIGRFHPLVVHFPIALLIASAVAEALGALRGRTSYSQTARFCLTFGTFGAVVAAALGWALAYGHGYPKDLVQPLFLHRWIGTSTAALAVLTWFLSRSENARNSPRHRALLALLVVGVSVAGHYGATLIYGPGYLF
jgi:uncharacterized membrane protein